MEAYLYPSGIDCWCIDAWYIKAKAGDISHDVFFKNIACILSGSQALFGLKAYLTTWLDQWLQC